MIVSKSQERVELVGRDVVIAVTVARPTSLEPVNAPQITPVSP